MNTMVTSIFKNLNVAKNVSYLNDKYVALNDKPLLISFLGVANIT